MRRLLLAGALLVASAAPAVALSPTPGHPQEVLAWAQVDRNGRSVLVVADADGSESFVVGGGIAMRGRPSVAPTGDGVAVSAPLGEQTGRYGIARVGFDGRTEILTRPDVADLDPAWSPDGRRLAAVRRTCSVLERYACSVLITVDATGAHAVSTLVQSSRVLHDPAWNADGTQIAYTDSSGLWVAPAAGGAPVRLVKGSGLSQPQFSPTTGDLVVVQALKGGQRLLVAGARGLTPITRTTTGLDSPQWAPDGTSVLVVSYAGTGDAGRRKEKLLQVFTDRRVAVLRTLPSTVHGLGHGFAVSP